MIHKHGDWVVEVSDDPDFRGDHFRALFDTTFKAGTTCERFTLFDDAPGGENAIVQVLMFGAEKVQVWCYTPCMIQVYRRQKVVMIGVCPHKRE